MTPSWQGMLNEWQQKAPKEQVVKMLTTTDTSAASVGVEYECPTMWTSNHFKDQKYEWETPQRQMMNIAPPQPPEMRQNFIHNQCLTGVFCGGLEHQDTDARDAALGLMTVTKENFL